MISRYRTVRDLLWSGEPVHEMIRGLLHFGYTHQEAAGIMLRNHALSISDYWHEVFMHDLEEL